MLTAMCHVFSSQIAPKQKSRECHKRVEKFCIVNVVETRQAARKCPCYLLISHQKWNFLKVLTIRTNIQRYDDNAVSLRIFVLQGGHEHVEKDAALTFETKEIA